MFFEFPPALYCSFGGRLWLAWAHTIGDAEQVAFYAVIGTAIWLARDWLELSTRQALACTGFFYFCGLGHLADIGNVWWGIYDLHAVAKNIAGPLSGYFGWVLWKKRKMGDFMTRSEVRKQAEESSSIEELRRRLNA